MPFKNCRPSARNLYVNKIVSFYASWPQALLSNVSIYCTTPIQFAVRYVSARNHEARGRVIYYAETYRNGRDISNLCRLLYSNRHKLLIASFVAMQLYILTGSFYRKLI